MRILIKSVLSPFICHHCSRTLRYGFSAPQRTVTIPALRHTSTSIHYRRRTNHPTSTRDDRSSHGPTSSSVPHIKPEDIRALTEATVSGNPDPVQACRILQKLATMGCRVPSTHFRQLSMATGRLLETVLLDGGDISSLPLPEEIIAWCDKLGLRPNSHYDMLLIRMVSQEKPVAEVLPLFEAAIRSRLGIRGNEELVIDAQPSKNPFISGSQSNRDGRVLFLTYTYLWWKGCNFRGVMARLHSRMHILASQDILDSIDDIVKLLPNSISQEMKKAASEVVLRPLLEDFYTMRVRLKGYTERNDLHGLREFYRSIRALDPSPLTEFHYAQLISAFTNIWRSKETVMEIWDDMTRFGITPSKASWTSLLRYSKNLQSPTAVSDIWNRMIEAGIEPDVHTWTARISLELEAGRFSEGLKLFEAMMHAGCQPTAATVNAAVSALIRHRRMDIAAKVLIIADQFGIPPDVTTYNTILKESFQKSNVPAAIEVIKSMHERGCEPDFSTFTILLDGLGRHQANSSDAGNEDMLIQILGIMKNLGITVRIHTYTALLQYLLNESPPRHEVTNAVIGLMRQDKARPNAETYTVFIHAAFARGDLAAVNEYWQEMKNTSVWRDHVLWAETILGFAQAGDLIRTEELLEELRAFNKHSSTFRPKVVITLGSYTSLLLAVERRGDYRLARKIVVDVVKDWKSRLVADHNWTGGPAEKKWWDLVERIGGRQWAVEMKGIADQGLGSTPDHSVSHGINDI